MKLAVFGLWHLGTVTAACTAAAGISTIAIDLDHERIAKLAKGEPPLYEPGLAELIRSGLASGDLAFGTEKGARLYRNVKGNFEDASAGTKFGVLAEPRLAFAIGDFDQDGDDDALALEHASPWYRRVPLSSTPRSR